MPAMPPTRATALASTLSAFRGWNLLIHCAGCRVMRRLSINELAKHVGDGAVLRNVLPRLRCTDCGELPRRVKLSDGPGPGAREVWVVGSAQSM